MDDRSRIDQDNERMRVIKRKGIPHPMPVSQPTLADLGWTSGSHCKPRAHSGGGGGGVGSGDELRPRGTLAKVMLIP